MAEELRKLAEIIRAEAVASEQTRREKSAQLIHAAVGLEHLRKKIGR